MGSLDKYCRLCALHVRPDQLLKIFTDQSDQGERTITANGAKLKDFLSFNIATEDRLPKQVCVQCVQNLDYCVHFVDKCRRIESLLQRGLDVDYVASEVDYRYTYLFPSPYPAGPEVPPSRPPIYPPDPSSRPADPAQPYFGHSRVEGDGVACLTGPHVSPEQRVRRAHGPYPQQVVEGSTLATPTVPPPPHRPPEDSDQGPHSGGHHNSGQQLGGHDTGGQQGPSHSQVPSSHSSVVTSAQQKVAMYRNDVSVDNVVVEIEPNDLFPRKAGNVRPEYPWKVGGATKRSATQARDKRVEGGTLSSNTTLTTSTSSPSKSARFILPKSDPVSNKVRPGGPSQVMIPVTLKTPCKVCGKLIIASSLQDLKNHVCQGGQAQGSDSSSQVEVQGQDQFDCTEEGCGKRLPSRSSLKYHQKHCHKKKEPGPGLDIMSIATSELVGGNCKEETERKTQTDQENFSTNCLPRPEYPAPGKGRPGGEHKKVFVCPYQGCSKAYSASNYLVQHERLHTGERPYSCSNCGKCFSRVLDMKKHSLLKVCF